jgi:glucokinase
MQQKMEKPLALGVDLGGTKVETALVDASGKIISSHRYSTNPEKGALRIIDDVVACVEKCLDKGEEDAQALGIGVAAQVDHSGVVLSSPNLGWQNVPLREKLEEKLKLPVVVINDVRAASWGEWHFGAGKGIDDFVVIFVGTGIGGGVVSGGRMLEGCSNTAGEIGHTTIIVDGRNCSCPNKGCLEAYAGGWAIAERAQEAVQANPEAGKALISLAGGVEKITAALVSQAYHEGDVLSSKLVKETTQYLSAGLVSVVNSFNPCLLVVGGGVVDGLPELIKTAEPFIKKRALKAAAQNLKVVKAALGNEAGIVGAAALAQDHLKKTV